MVSDLLSRKTSAAIAPFYRLRSNKLTLAECVEATRPHNRRRAQRKCIKQLSNKFSWSFFGGLLAQKKNSNFIIWKILDEFFVKVGLLGQETGRILLESFGWRPFTITVSVYILQRLASSCIVTELLN